MWRWPCFETFPPRELVKQFVIAAALFVLNLYFCRELFYTAYIPAMSSVEGSFISISRYAMDNLHELQWVYRGTPTRQMTKKVTGPRQ
jgi:hypothetical protein